MGVDLGTYHLKVEFTDGTGYFQEWGTGSRFIGGGSDGFKPLTAWWAAPIYETEADLFVNMVSMYTSGNYDCDCNRKAFLDRANQCEKEWSEGGDDPYPCGDTQQLAKLTAIRPDGSQVVLLRVVPE